MESLRRSILLSLFGEQEGTIADQQLQAILDSYRVRLPRPHRQGLSQADTILITYPDQVKEAGRFPLHSLAEFCEKKLIGLVSGIHLLPFYPASSDDGFSVIDYRAVDPAFGEWADITRLGEQFRLMFDAVINHASAQSDWFQAFLQDDPTYMDYFITIEGEPDLSQVVRPRALPLLTRFNTPSGEKAVWTTFSADQIDLNYHNPAVLLEIIDLLLDYVSRGAEFIRLDAIAYLWKEIGTACIHRPQTHWIIQLMRAVLDEVAPQVMLITETNVPHAENLSYFGDGTNEAQLIYNFALPPLVLHAFQSGDASIFADWVAGLWLPSNETTFFNFLASHDGIGLNPAHGLLPDSAIDGLVNQVIVHGGLISEKHNPDGSASPYELNINFFDALSNPAGREPLSLQIDRFVAAHAILLAIPGVPGIYFHSLFGSRGWPEGVRQTGQNRTINRQKLLREELERQLSNPDSLRAQVFSRLGGLMRLRAGQTVFHPSAKARVVECQRAILGLLRISPDGLEQALCLHNLTAQRQPVDIDLVEFGLTHSVDLISRQPVTGPRVTLHLKPYQVVWIKSNE
jgi:sucrose phosphorylase